MHHQIRHLKKSDKKLAKVIRRIKLKPLEKSNEHFQHLVESIISQQISLKAAASITKKFIALFSGKKFPAPKDVLAKSDRMLRAAGISGQKAAYIKNIARAELDFKKIKKMSDEEVVEELTKIKGIGRWTAEMFLMFSLGREDVFSYGDLGLLNGMVKIYGLRKLPSRKKAKEITDKWRPYRTLGSRYMWEVLDNKPKS